LDGAQLVVVTSAVGPDNPEVRAASAMGIPVLKRAELLAAIADGRRGIAVAGTHGKTTTSSLIGHLLTASGLDPTILVGGVSLDLGSNMRVGAGDLVVVEADEYDASFLRLHPHTAVITNVEPEHLDFYGTFERVWEAFQEFARNATDCLIVCADDPGASSLLPAPNATVTRYGLAAGDYRATDLREDGREMRFRLDSPSGTRECSMLLAGRHNVLNALAAIAAAESLGAPLEAVTDALRAFRGVARRLEVTGESGGILLLDDYAHHPTEIRADLLAIRERFRRPIRLIFQPHTFSRTRHFLEDFAASFTEADAVYLLDIYAARETNTYSVCSQELARAAKQRGAAVLYTGTMEATREALLRDARRGDVVVTMGAGDVYRLGAEIMEGLRHGEG
ncbi:MAG: UDP-N-acetylmuramate--L-alanine ligase, partial [Chloroflexi bacterium]|nr:UDP-N-acetylmuramate--L-alanine ligase [Chloroflexota bacterium]